jgi:hypothetical protein
MFVPKIRHNSTWLAGCLAMGVAFVIALQPGCKRSTPAAPVNRKPAIPDAQEEFPFKAMNGASVRSSTGKEGVRLPGDLPADVAIYPKATPTLVATLNNETKILLATPDAWRKVADFYKQRMKKDGWKIAASTYVSQTVMLQGEKGKRTFVVLVSEESGKTVQISLTYQN